MKRTIYRIVPHKASKAWVVHGDGVRWWATKCAAVPYYAAKCRAIRAAGGLAQLVICRRNGTVQEERTYGRDPRRSRG